MFLPVYVYGTPVLRQVAEDITPDYPELSKLIENMWDTMYKSDGVGLAAPQIGRSIRLLVIDADAVKDYYPESEGFKRTMINARILSREGKEVSAEEGCLSVPGINEKVTRLNKVTVRYLDENFQEHEETLEGFPARVVQHEYDHLEGMLFIDHISPIRKQLIRNKLNNIVKGKVRCSYRIKTV